MMNYQYPASYMLENADQLLKIGPTPPPILPSLDQNEIEQTLYQRRVSDSNTMEAPADSLQPLQINYQTQYYQPPNTQYSPPAQQRSAPVQNPTIIGGAAHTQSAVLFSKTPRSLITNKVSNNVNVPTSKPPTTPPPPPADTKVVVVNTTNISSSSSSVSANSHSHHSKPTLSAHGHSHNDIVAITPQSHANHLNSNSASNHSTASNNTTTTTVIESASHSSHSSHSPHSPKQQIVTGHHKPIISTQNILNVVHKSSHVPTSKIPAPQLANPLPAGNQQKIGGVTEGIVIPMDQQNYTALLSQMYGNQVPTVNGHYAAATTQDVNAQYGAATYSRNAYQQSTIQDDLSEILTAPSFNIYGSYDSNPYALYNTPPLPSNHGYYTNPTSTATAATSNYYQHQPHTAPSHVLSPPHAHHSTIPKSADIYNQTTNSYTHQPQYTYHTHSHQQPQTQQVSTTNYYHTTHQQQQQQSPHSSHHLSQQSPKTISNTSPHSHHSRSNKSHQHQLDEITADALPAQFLHRCDGTIISPHANPVTVQQLVINNGKGDELDAFTAGDDALFGNNMVTIISVNWTTNIPYATVRIHISNRIHHVPLMDLTHLSPDQKNMGKKNKGSQQQQNGGNNGGNNRYRLGMNAANGLKQLAQQQQGGMNVNGVKVGEEPGSVEQGGAINMNGIDIGGTVIRRNPKLSDETLMKLPHLRKHREYIRTIDVNMGPKDYNSYRVSVNSKGGNNNSDGDEHSDNANNGRTANIQNLNAKQPSTSGNGGNRGNLNANNGGGGRKKNKRMSACEKGDLFKTELCENWVKKGHCTYGKKCHFAHGREDIRTRWRIENYKTQPCCDPARADSRLCLFGKRCNYAHPGEPLRRSHHQQYLDEEYQAEILKDYGPTTPYPFGIYI